MRAINVSLNLQNQTKCISEKSSYNYEAFSGKT